MCGNRLGLIIIHGFGHHPAPLLGYIRENGNESSAETSPTNCHLFPQNQAVLAVVPQSDARIR